MFFIPISKGTLLSSKFSKPQYARRTVLSVAAISALVVATGCASTSPSSSGGGGQVVIATYGGTTGDALQAAYFDDFTKETGIKVVQVPADPAKFVSMAREGKSDWDSINADGGQLGRWAKEGIIEKMASDVPRSDLVTDASKDYAGGRFTFSFVIAYRKSAFPTAPQNWADFWDTKKFPGKRGMAGSGYHWGAAEAALLADGVSEDKLYPLDLERAFRKLDEIKPSVTVYESMSALAQGLQSGSVDMALMSSGRAGGLITSDPDIEAQWNQNIAYPADGFPIAKGAPNPEGMNKLLTFMQDPKRQAVFAEKATYGPTMSKSFETLPPETAKLLPGSDEHRKLEAKVDPTLYADQEDDYVKRYSDWLTR
ncbi:ABC transporter substrate-binding protein [Paenarthrobacter nitroguajacolicus]